MIRIISPNYRQRDKSETNPCRNLQTAVDKLALKTIPKVDDPELQKNHFQKVEGMLLSTFIAGLIGNAGQQVSFKLPHTFDKALQIVITVFEAEAQEENKKKAMKFLIPTRESRVLMLAQVLENLITLIGSCELACRQAVGRRPVATVRQEDSRLSKYITYPRDAGCRIGLCVMIVIDRHPALNTAIS